MNIYSVYKCVNKIDGRVYIGIDKNWPTRRYAHKSLAKRGSKYHFHTAIRKYGWENFEWSVIYTTKDYTHLKEIEQHFISEHNSYENGYNSTLGGEGTLGKKQSKINKEKQSRLRFELNQKSCWYNNGTENTFSPICPGGWVKGRLNQKPTTKNRKWYNDGNINRLFNVPPDSNWKMGMLR